mmetsp:Transcript_9186/g.30280  ORF Transcript_9186/g.30280 Transcript_9186/m.30280 type:complete len:208 (+) Transcript_9186:261-884(+)
MARTRRCISSAISTSCASEEALIFSRRSINSASHSPAILKMWPFTIRSGVGCSAAKARYSERRRRVPSAASSGAGAGDSPRVRKRAGLQRRGSALRTPSAPVAAMSASASSRLRTSPFASTGMDTASLTALMAAQSARWSLAFFWSRVRPCTARTWQPASSSMRAYASVRSSSGKMRILHVTGTFRFAWRASTNDRARGKSSIKKAP